MIFEELAAYCEAWPGVTSDRPFGPEVVVFRVMGKIFALVDPDTRPLAVNLKCEPDWALSLRDQYTAVRPGYHMNKRHWNTVTLDGTIPEADVRAMIDHSYRQVVKGLRRIDRERLAALAEQS